MKAKTRRSSLRLGRKGQSTLEFSLVLLALLLVMIGITDFARLYYTYATISNAAREGARYGITNYRCVSPSDGPECADPNNIIYHANALLHTLGSTATIDVDCPGFPSCRDAQPGRPLVVTVSVTFDALTPLIPTLTLTSQSTMYIEGW